MAQAAADIQLADKQWNRYSNAMMRGHTDYQTIAKICENFYLGGGRQWDDKTKASLNLLKKPWTEENFIFSTVNTVCGVQTQSRMDIAYKPREVGEQDVSDVLTKLGMYIIDQNRFPWLESQAFADGLIQQRGFYDIRMNYDNNFFGEVEIKTLDPLDVIPDPDGKTYDPDGWQDVMVTSWISLSDLKEEYGLSKYRQVISQMDDEADFGSDGFGIERNRFASFSTYNAYYKDTTGEEHVRLIDRQWYKIQMRLCWYNLENGDYIYVPDNLSQAQAKKYAKDNGLELTKKLHKRIRWTVSTKNVVLHDEWSPYEHFTIVPYFPYFRRGVTIGLVDNLIKPQEMLNKIDSQIVHTINTTANSGWIIEENSLTNMDVEDLEVEGGKTGLILEYKTGREKPEKIKPNEIPSGLVNASIRFTQNLQQISGVSEAFRGEKGPEVSGDAIQSRVAQSAVSLATPIDHLFRTRNLLAHRLLKLMQTFMTDQRTFRITTSDESTEDEIITINELIEGGKLNDISVGKYDVVISDVPTQVTFQNAQMAQALDMRKFGVNIPDEEMILLSTLSRKQEIAKKVSGELTPEIQQQQAEQLRLQVEALRKQVEKLESEAKANEMESIVKAAEVAQLLQQNPGLAVLVDKLREDLEDESEEDTVEKPELPKQQLGAINV